MENVINPFKRAGIGLLTIGLLDIGVMVYCIMNRISYSSNFNIFAVIAGIFLLRGGVKTARVIRWFFAFFIFGCFGMILLFPLLLPLDLLATQFKSNPVGVLFSYSIPALYLAIIIWIYLELSTTSSKEIYNLNPAIGNFAEDVRHRRRRRIKILQAFGNVADLVKLPIPKGVEGEKK